MTCEPSSFGVWETVSPVRATNQSTKIGSLQRSLSGGGTGYSDREDVSAPINTFVTYS